MYSSVNLRVILEQFTVFLEGVFERFFNSIFLRCNLDFWIFWIFEIFWCRFCLFSLKFMPCSKIDFIPYLGGIKFT